MEKLARAAVYEGPERVVIRDFPLPTVGTGEMLVEVVVAGVDGSEVHQFRGEVAAINEVAPVILGDEIVGRVVEVGRCASEVRRVDKGDLVVVEARWPCSECDFCRHGQYYMCEKGWVGRGYGRTSCAKPPYLWGAYATHVFVPSDALVYRVPQGMDADTALITGSVLANALRWTEPVKLGQTVVVIGPGPQGLCCGLLAVLRGADAVVVVGREQDSERLAMARRLGATATVTFGANMTAAEVAGEVFQAIGRRGVDVVIEAAGSQSAMDLAVEVVRPQGKIVHVSVSSPRRLNVDFHALLFKEVAVLNPYSHPLMVRRSLDLGLKLADKGVNLSALITHSFGLERAEQALRTAGYEYGERPIKVVIRPGS